MCDGNRLHSIEPKRCQADDPLWDFYSSIKRPTLGIDQGGKRFQTSLREMIQLAKERFPYKQRTQWNLTVSHKTRMRLNKEYNEMDAVNNMEKLWIPQSKKPSPNSPQDMWLFPGLIMIAYISTGKAGSVHNGQLFEVMEWLGGSVSVNGVSGSAVLRDIESMEVIELPLEFVRDNLRLGYAFTNVGCQGRSLGNFQTDKAPTRGVTVWDTDSRYFTLAHLFTGTSRARSGELLQVV